MITRKAVLGWSRTTVRLPADAVVLDVGCGAFPNDAATIACDMSLDEDRHRTGRATQVDRPFVLCDASALPFRDGAVDFVIASHIGEHVDDPERFCRELSRVASSGYVETPSPLADYLLDEEYHQWRVASHGSTLVFARKRAKGRLTRRATDRFYRAFYAGREMGAPTYRLPANRAGRVARFVLRLIRGVLNRSGVMHTRVSFGPDAPLRCRVVGDAELSTEPRRVVIVERGRSSGFLEGDRLALSGIADLEIVRYPGWPSPAFLLGLWRATGSAEVVYTFFASEHALPAAVIARVRRKRFVVSVGGYDVARVGEHGYGLPTRFPHRLIPRIVLRLADRVLPMSEAVRAEALAAGALDERTEVVRLGVEAPWAGEPGGQDRNDDQVVTVGYVDEVSWSRKGFDRFVDAARRDLGRRYVLVGRVAASIAGNELAEPPPNLVLTGFVDDEELGRILRSSGVYAQLSWHEGFGVSMVEAMLAGCRPVVSGVPALREVAGPCAVLSEDARGDAEAIGRAASEPVDRAAMAQWARDIASVEGRACGLGAALFPGG